MPLLIPINLMEVAIRPLALCMRLFGNILGAFIIMEMLKISAGAGGACRRCSASTSTCLTGSFRPSSLCSLTTLFTGEGIKEEHKSIAFRRKSL